MIHIGEIVSLVALNFDCDPVDLVASRRNKDLILPRHLAMFVAKRTTSASLAEIGRHFGGRDHSTVHAAIEKIEADMKADARLKALAVSLEQSVELRQRIAAMGGVDVLAVAGRISANPVRAAMRVSVMEITALAATLIDLWETAQTAEALIVAHAVEMTGNDSKDDEREQLISALTDAITNQMAALRGDDEENDHDC